MAIRRRDVLAFAAEHNIELEILEFPRGYSNHGRSGINHVHAYTPVGMVFGTADLHNLSLWDQDCAVAIDWGDVMASLCESMPVPCPFLIENGGTGCEVCDEEPEQTVLYEDEDGELLEEIREAGGTV